MILAKQDQLQQRGEKKFKSKQYWRSNIFIFVKIMKIAAICFQCIELMLKDFYVFLFMLHEPRGLAGAPILKRQ